MTTYRDRPETTILLGRVPCGWCLGPGLEEGSHSSPAGKTGSLRLHSLCKQRGLCRTPVFLLGTWASGPCEAEGAYVTTPKERVWALSFSCTYLGRNVANTLLHFYC